MNKALLQIIAILMFASCATIVSPDGGPKDSQAPEALEISPSNYTVQFASRNIKFVFDEFIKIKNLEAELVSSPPMTTPKATVKGKLLLLTFEDSLKANTTYTLNFGNAIVDLNEGNPIEDFKYTFSTGDYIDSLSFQGLVEPVLEKELPEKMWVMAYKMDEEWTDSIPFLQKPDYLSRVKNKLFRIDNMSAGQYQLIAFEDKNKDYLLNETEFQGFISKPQLANTDSVILEIPCYQPEGKLGFKGMVQKKFDRLDFGFNRAIFNEDSLSISFMDSALNYIDQSVIIRKDSAFIYINQGFDSLKVEVAMTNAFDSITWFAKNLDTNAIQLKFESPIKLNYLDTFWVQTSMRIEGVDTSEISLKKDSLELSFATIVEENRFAILYPFEFNTSYLISIDKSATFNKWKLSNDSTETTFTLMNKEDYGTMELLASQKSGSLVHLIGAKNKLVKSVLIENYPYSIHQILPGKYALRFITDANNNGRWDAGDYLMKRQPENCKYYPEGIDIRANWDLEIQLD